MELMENGSTWLLVSLWCFTKNPQWLTPPLPKPFLTLVSLVSISGERSPPHRSTDDSSQPASSEESGAASSNPGHQHWPLLSSLLPGTVRHSQLHLLDHVRWVPLKRDFSTGTLFEWQDAYKTVLFFVFFLLNSEHLLQVAPACN